MKRKYGQTSLPYRRRRSQLSREAKSSLTSRKLIADLIVFNVCRVQADLQILFPEMFTLKKFPEKTDWKT